MPTHTYGWDATGNRSQAGSVAGTLAYHYPATSHRLTSVGGQARSYDAAGNTTQMNGLTYAYNSAGRLGQVKQGATSLGIYRYNHRGERVLRQAAGKTTTTLYDESGQWLGEYSANGVPLQQVVWLENYPIAVFSESSAGVPALGYVQPDHLGTPRVIIDATRNVPVWEWALTGEAFGADAANEDPDGDGVAFGFALRFPGQQATPESGLSYNYQRDYDAVVGRYVQSDPIGLAGGSSTYAYANGQPNRLYDPLGLKAVCRCTDQGATIDLNLKFEGEGATADVTNAMRESIEAVWRGPGFEVRTRLGGRGASKISVPAGSGRSHIKGNRGTWYASNDPWVAAHEAGHLMKLDDRYIELEPGKTAPQPGWERTIMAEHMGEATERDRRNVFDALNCDCDCGASQ